ncbi:hypothetical protein GGI11_000039 [Coemansia sp. RSA 2049]|nr:hypothetical protein GGI11_000039 [Coemansia sp. RSA 2049]KAJ2586914.1 hypothetical protein EV177_009686 [Coemansia sp. RSA 1804]KAJ2645569.1 hypothetical protein GGH99_008229 [Coemansia sp. RSA 1285]
MRLASIYQIMILAAGVIALPAKDAAPDLAKDHSSGSAKQLYQGPHLPPGMRRHPRVNSLHRRRNALDA